MLESRVEPERSGSQLEPAESGVESFGLSGRADGLTKNPQHDRDWQWSREGRVRCVWRSSLGLRGSGVGAREMGNGSEREGQKASARVREGD